MRQVPDGRGVAVRTKREEAALAVHGPHPAAKRVIVYYLLCAARGLQRR